MATTYRTTVEKVSVIKTEDTLTNVIQTAWYTIWATSDDGYEKILMKMVTLPTPTPEGFIDINSVTEEMLTSWIEAQPDYLTQDDIDSLEFRFEMERERPSYEDYKMSWMPDDPMRYNLVG